MKTRSAKESEAYMAGWMQRHKGPPTVPVVYVPAWVDSDLEPWFTRGWNDCNRGAIDAESALGPDLRVEGKRYGDS
jgi:hypothetical protein